MRGSANVSSRVTGIDVLRAIAVLLVLSIHWQGSQLFAPKMSAVDRLANSLAQSGAYGVTLFFVISGFVITRSVMGRPGGLFRIKPKRFYIRRIARIQPLFIATVILGITCLALAPRIAIFRFVFSSGNRFTSEFWLSVGTFWFNMERVQQGLHHMYWGLHWDV